MHSDTPHAQSPTRDPDGDSKRKYCTRYAKAIRYFRAQCSAPAQNGATARARRRCLVGSRRPGQRRSKFLGTKTGALGLSVHDSRTSFLFLGISNALALGSSLKACLFLVRTTADGSFGSAALGPLAAIKSILCCDRADFAACTACLIPIEQADSGAAVRRPRAVTVCTSAFSVFR